MSGFGAYETIARAHAVEVRRRLLSAEKPPSVVWSAPLPKQVRHVPVKARVFQPGEKLVVTSMEEVPVTPFATTEQIIAEVCAKHKVAAKDVLSPIRSQFVIPARFEAIYRLREEKLLSWAQIGRIFKRDHTTALAAWRCHKQTLGRTDAE